jgi:hypothetical protein
MLGNYRVSKQLEISRVVLSSIELVSSGLCELLHSSVKRAVLLLGDILTGALIDSGVTQQRQSFLSCEYSVIR